MYTADNILGLKVTHRNNVDNLDNPGVVYTITETGVDYYHNNNINTPSKAHYLPVDMAHYLNEGDWLLIATPVNNTFPIY